MKKLAPPCLGLVFAAALVHAGPAEDAAAAATKLAAAPNYSWTRTTEIASSQFSPAPLEGQTEKGGFTVTTVPERLAKLESDPWAEMRTLHQSIGARLRREAGI